MKRHPLMIPACAALAGLLAAGCANPVVPVHPIPVPVVVVRPAGASIYRETPPAPERCANPYASLAPTGALPAPGSAAARAVLPAAAQRGYLKVGVSQDTLHWGYRDPRTNSLTGFDVDMLQQIALAMFGSDDRAHLHFVVVPNADRAQAVHTGKVDIVAETMTITCSREHDTKVNGKTAYPVDFSSVYYDAHQRVLVSDTSNIRGIADLAGKRVCASKGSTSLQNLARLKLTPKPILWQVTNQTDCLVMLQQGQVDAISTDDTILAGLAEQDPHVKLLGGPALSPERYGMAISKANPAFERFVNAVLAGELADGTWTKLASKNSVCAGQSNCTITPPPTGPYRP
jgi:polar amino acid transport system substrate-binding protein